MIKELKGNAFLVLPEREQVLEIKYHNGGYDLGGRMVSDVDYISYRSFDISNRGRAPFFGRMIATSPLDRMTTQELISDLIQHIYGFRANEISGYIVTV